MDYLNITTTEESILNRINRKKLLKENKTLVNKITTDDFFLDNATDDCLDLFYIAEKIEKT